MVGHGLSQISSEQSHLLSFVREKDAFTASQDYHPSPGLSHRTRIRKSAIRMQYFASFVAQLEPSGPFACIIEGNSLSSWPTSSQVGHDKESTTYQRPVNMASAMWQPLIIITHGINSQ